MRGPSTLGSIGKKGKHSVGGARWRGWGGTGEGGLPGFARAQNRDRKLESHD